MLMKSNLALLLLFTLSLSSAWAKKVRIIHTNDLHSFFLSHDDGKGGYAKLATLIAKLKQKSRDEGIPSLTLDGGDWGEGHSFYLVDKGRRSIKALDILGIDAAVLGNHDHMFGQEHLVDKIRSQNISTKILSANMRLTPEMNAHDVILPHYTFTLDGMKIAVVGLSTHESHYSAYINPGFVKKPIPTARKIEKALAKRTDAIIAVTHLGVKVDKKLARRTRFIDVIVGGHSHTRLDEVVWVNNRKRKAVPIVQTGAHARAVGELVIDVQKGKPVKVISYKLHDVEADTEEKADVGTFVDNLVMDHAALFDNRLDEVIGESEIELDGYRNGNNRHRATCWGHHQAKMVKEQTGADIGFHLSTFNGSGFNPGVVTYGMIMENFPHVNQFGDQGWKMATFKINGELLRALLKVSLTFRDLAGISVYGLTYKKSLFPRWMPVLGDRIRSRRIRINGKRINPFKKYTVAIPSEMIYTFKVMMPAVAKALFKKYKVTDNEYWPVTEDYVRRNSPLKCLDSYKSLERHRKAIIEELDQN